MKSIFKMATMVAVVLCIMLCVATGASAGTNFSWDCTGLCSGDWTDPDQWSGGTGSNYPGSGSNTDNVDIASSGTVCTLDLGTVLTVNSVEVTGASPSWRKLIIQDAELKVSGGVILGDYGELDVDADLTIGLGEGLMFIEGNARIDVAENATLLTQFLDCRGTNAHLSLTTAGTFEVFAIGVDADHANAPRTLKLSGGTIDLRPPTGGPSAVQIVVRSDPDGNGRAKLWVRSTTLSFDGIHPVGINLHGGTDAGEEAQLDLDESVIDETTNSFVLCTGLVDVDIAANKTFSMRRLIVGSATGTAVATLTTGSGAEWKTDIVD